MAFRGSARSLRDSSRAASSAPDPAAPPRAEAAAGRRRTRGQGLVEFAISLPVVLLMILFGVDFGRVFLGWVTLNNAVREAANFAAMNPTAWSSPGSPSARAEYERLITADAAAINCTLPATLPGPTFPSGTDLGLPAVVRITCEFGLITPIIGNILGSPLDVSASASFPIRSGVIDGTPVGGTLPTFSAGTATEPPEETEDPEETEAPTPIPTPSQLVTPVPECTVPNLTANGGVRTNQATKAWTDNGFAANNLLFNPLVPPHYRIHGQSETAGDSIPCTSSMTVTP